MERSLVRETVNPNTIIKKNTLLFINFKLVDKHSIGIKCDESVVKRLSNCEYCYCEQWLQNHI